MTRCTHDCHQGRKCQCFNCPDDGTHPGTEFTAFERFVVLILFVLVLYFAASVVLRWGLI